MLEELKRLKSPGTKEDILFFLQAVIGSRSLSIEDIRAICSHAPGKYQLAVNELINYCSFFDWIRFDSIIFIDEKMKLLINCKEKLNEELVSRTVNVLFDYEVFEPSLFYYDTTNERFIFKNDNFPLVYSAVRNVLASQNFFDIQRSQYTTFFINPNFEDIVTFYCKKYNTKITLDQLKRQLEKNAKIGEAAEKYVLQYEVKRLSYCVLSEKVRIISDIDVGAGYDIISFDKDGDENYNRFIEVKAISINGFYWSKNELETAKIKGSQYHLYLVELGRIDEANYEPIIITNPAELIIKSTDWLVEAQTYHVRHV